jgi:hypothetical protein
MVHQAYERQLRRKGRKPIPQDTHSLAEKIIKKADPGTALYGMTEETSATKRIASRARKPRVSLHRVEQDTTLKVASKKPSRASPIGGRPELGSTGIHPTVHIHVHT